MSIQKGADTGSGRFLVVLLGNLAFDGRVQRMVEVLRGLGTVVVVDVSGGGKREWTAPEGVERIAVRPPAGLRTLGRHVWLGVAALRLARRYRPDWVVAEDYLTVLSGWLAARRARAGLIYDAHELIVPEAGRRQRWRNRCWYWLERWVVRRAELVIAANEERAGVMAGHYGLKGEVVTMRNIPQPTDDREREPGEAVWPELERRGPEDRLIVYQGYLSLGRGLGRFIGALAYLPAAYRLILAGGGPDEGAIREMVERKGLGERVALLGRIANRDLVRVSRACDVGIVCYSFEGLNNLYCAPNKVFEYAQAGLPVVATGQPGLGRLVSEYGIGELVGQEDGPETVAGALVRIIQKGKEHYVVNLQSFTVTNSWAAEAGRVRAAIMKVNGKVNKLHFGPIEYGWGVR